jgi:hypothetical protein
MSTRLYLASSGTATPNPALYLTGSTWTSDYQVPDAATCRPCSTTKTNTALTNYTFTETFGGMGDGFLLLGRWVTPALPAMTLSGTIKGQMRCSETSTSMNSSLAVGIRLLNSDGSHAGYVLQASGYYSTGNTAPEMATTLTNRQFLDWNGNFPVELTSTSVSSGQFLEIQIGYRNSNANGSVSINVGDPSGTGDLPEDNTTTSALVPWIEFSADLGFVGGGPSFQPAWAVNANGMQH